MAQRHQRQPGRPRGTSKAQAMRDAIAADVPAILAVLVQQAKAGDVQAARVLLERALPALKPQELPQAVALPEGGTLAASGGCCAPPAMDGHPQGRAKSLCRPEWKPAVPPSNPKHPEKR